VLPSDELIPLADRLAESLCSETGLATFRLMVQLHKLSARRRDPAEERPSFPKDRSKPIRVGIWEQPAGQPESPFVRLGTGDRRRLWADVPEISSKGTKQRVAFIGESVARGFFYDPYINPASVLESLLNHATGADDIEVIDLARIDLPMGELLSLTQSAVALRPDAIAIFAGNNWHPVGSLGPEQIRERGSALRNGASWHEVKTHLEGVLEEQVRGVLRCLGRISEKSHVPILLLIPEFNLADWKCDAGAPVLTSDHALFRWFKIREEAEDALRDGRDDEAFGLAQEIIAIDQGTTPVGFNLQAQAARNSATPAALRALREQARDAAIALTKLQTPRCFKTAQNVLRENAAQYGIKVVDLPQRFDEYLGGELPGRRIFHDYCHLTLEGMRVAMAAAAEPLLSLLSRQPADWRSLVNVSVSVPKKVRGEAYFLAAVHNANFGNSAEMVEFHLDKAIRLYPPVAETMRLYVNFHLRKAPSPLCDSFETMARIGSNSLLSLLLHSSLTGTEKVINFDLVERIVRAAELVQPGVQQETKKLIIQEHKITPERRNLLQKMYAGVAGDSSWHQDAYAYHRSSSRHSRFAFVSECPDELELRITSRTNTGGGGKWIFIKVNDAEVHCFEGRDHWQATKFIVPAHAVREGINVLEIVWPEEGWSSPQRISRIIDALEMGRIPEACAVYGELHEVTIARARVSPPSRPENALVAETSA
jgi:hypothetical protein